MQAVFHGMMDKHIIPFFKAQGFDSQDINSETNKTLGIDSYYFYKIDGDINRNFYFESNSENTAEQYDFKLDFGIYPYSVYQTIGFPHNDAPSGLGNLFYLASEDIFADKAAWQSITKKTDVDAFAKALLTVLEGVLDTHKTVDGVDDLIPFCINQKSNAYNHNYLIRYLKIADKKAFLDTYVAALRTADGSPLPDWMMRDVTALLDTAVLKQKVISNFTKGMKVPKSWENVLDWAEKNLGKVIGGHFEIIENSNGTLKYLVNMTDKAAKSLAVIGDNGADNVFCIWQKDKKNALVVLLGDMGTARVLAENMDDFIDLLAVGYYEVEATDYAQEPVFPEGTAHWKNTEFQAFYKKKFKKEVAKTGADIVARKTTTDADFFNWLCDNDANWAQWRK